MNRRFVLVVVLVLDIPSRLGVFEDEYDDENEDDRFMVPMHVQERKEAFHERPPLPAPPQRGGSGGEGGRTRPRSIDKARDALGTTESISRPFLSNEA